MARRKTEKNTKRRSFSDAVKPECKLEMLSNKELILDGCKGVIEYGENHIKLNTGEIMTGISGTGLLIKSFDNEIVVISGIITDITFVS